VGRKIGPGRIGWNRATDGASIRVYGHLLDIDPHLLEQVLRISGERTKTAAVTRALREYIARHEQRRIVELFAALEWDPSYHYKAERAR
jgi:Arc/MetJ family transcription regulator